MTNKRMLLGLALALALVLTQVSFASAAPLSQATSSSCTVQTVTQDSSGNWVVTCSNGSTATLTQDEAVKAGLITVDTTTGVVTQVWTAGMVITLDSSLLIADPCFVSSSSTTGTTSGTTGTTGGTSTDNNPVPTALAAFFCGGSSDGATSLEALHMEGFGFGEIAQALFMAQLLGNGLTAEQILMDKQNHDFSGLTLPDGSTPKNWGQLIKAVLGQEVRSMTNLGAIMSGRLTPTPTGTSTALAPANNGNGRGNNGNHGGNGHGHGNGHP